MDFQRPKVIKYGFTDFVVKDNFMSAKCRFCSSSKDPITDKIGTTSNFIKHLQRIHPDRYTHVFMFLHFATKMRIRNKIEYICHVSFGVCWKLIWVGVTGILKINAG